MAKIGPILRKGPEPDAVLVPYDVPLAAAWLEIFAEGGKVPVRVIGTRVEDDAPIEIEDAADWILSIPKVNPTTLDIPAAPSSKTGVDSFKYGAAYQYKNLGIRMPQLAIVMASVINEVEAFNDAVIAAAQPETLSFSIRRQNYTTPSTSNRRFRKHVAKIASANI